MQLLLEALDFRDPLRAQEKLAHLRDLPDAVLQHISSFLESSPDPDLVLHYLDRLRIRFPDAFLQIASNSTALRAAIVIFGYSAFLGEAILRNPQWIIDASDSADLNRVLSKRDYEERLRLNLNCGLLSSALLARFRRRELLRVVLRDVLQLGSLSDVTEEISNLADAILSVCVDSIRIDANRKSPGGVSGKFSVIALGKLGGQELNYSSDIDLMFVYSGDKKFFTDIANRLTELLSAYTEEGICYRIDLRLRPDGRFGEICQPLEAARLYYSERARDWELQMLIKARVAAGDTGPGLELLEFVEPLIYSTTLDFQAVESVAESRQRIQEKLKQSRSSCVDVKLASGGIRDIEFLVQCLQRLHGGLDRWVRHGGTMLALFRLRAKNFLSDREYARLAAAYQFLRQLEHRLQFFEDRQTHTLPADHDALETLSRRMPASTFHEATAGSLERELDDHLAAVRELYERVIHSHASISGPSIPSSAQPLSNLTRFLESQAPALMSHLRDAPLTRGEERLDHFLEKIAGDPVHLHLLESNSELTRAAFDFFENSPYFSDQLIRHPELLEEVEKACGERQGRDGFAAPEDPVSLRRFFHRQMVRIQSDSVYHAVDVYRTLRRTSALADSVIAAAYRTAIAETLASNPPRNAMYDPRSQMAVIALGRLGMHEFDLASDADLVFAIPDRDALEVAFWTAVAERLIHIISAYTGDGVIFTVDTRLRPNGRAGDLVQTESMYRNYFGQRAEAWEGIAYMKARCVAGDSERGTRFLNEIQEVDWRRYGQNGRSRRELAEMRARIEREQSPRNPLKAGPGGFYDIDFALLYLRLKGAGIFFRVLNTQERIDVVEKMGHLDRADAEFLREAATFYRAIDHGMRVATGHAEGTIPTAPARRVILGELVRRWSPQRFQTGSSEDLLHGSLTQVRAQVRAFFERVFQ